MGKKFNVTGTCIPERHYMVDISGKLEKITGMIEAGEYFTINRPRQYGKTTTMFLLDLNLDKGYLIIFDPRKSAQKEWKHDNRTVDGKEIFAVWV